MSVVRLDVLCDGVACSGHSVGGSLYVGDVWHWWLYKKSVRKLYARCAHVVRKVDAVEYISV